MEKFIKTNKSLFNTNEPSAQHFDNFLSKLENHKKNKANSLYQKELQHSCRIYIYAFFGSFSQLNI